MTDFPKFRTDEEAAAWFEANDISASDLETDPDITIASDLSVSVYGVLYESVTSASASASSASTIVEYDANRELVPAK